ncbi:homeobox-leucine zipper protein HDG11-like protein [Tanacetum coccineum]
MDNPAEYQGSTGGQQSQIQVQIVIQPQQLNDDPPVLTLEILENFFDDPPDDVNVELYPDFLQKLDAQLLAKDAISELNAVCTDSRLWAKKSGRDALIPSEYESRFPRPIINQSNTEASRDRHAYHMMDYKELAAMLMEVVIGNWSTLFPFMVAKEKKRGYFSYQSVPFTLNHLMGLEFRALAVVGWCPPRLSFERDQVENECESNCHRFASGCLIEDLNNGGSRVTWVENMGVSEINRGGMEVGAKEC